MASVLPQGFGKYVLKQRLAVGGMAEIFLGDLEGDRGFSKRVVIKRILPHFSADPDFVAMFIDEACIAARLNHANVVQIYDFGSVDGAYYIAMEYVDGLDLRALMTGLGGKGSSLSPAQVAAIGESVARGLHHAHFIADENGRSLELVHRDVSPHNIMLSRNGEAKITDFGIAKARDRATHTQTGAIKGKVAYMAPEQAVGGQVDARTDQFALGIVLWECLADRRLFDGTNQLSILHKVSECVVPPLSQIAPDVPEALVTIVEQMLSRVPSDRFASLEEVGKLLGAFRFSLGPEGAVHLDELVRDSMPHDVGNGGNVKNPQLTQNTLALPEFPQESSADTRQAEPFVKEAVTAGSVETDTALLPTKTVRKEESPTLISSALPTENTSQSPSKSGWGVVAVAVVAVAMWVARDKPLVSEQPIPKPPLAQSPSVVPVPPPTPVAPKQKVASPSVIKPLQRKVVEKTVVKRAPKKRQSGVIKKKRAEPKEAVTLGSGHLYLRTTEAWARVVLNGKELGVTPLANVEVPEGRHELLLINAEAGYQRRLELVVKNGEVIKKTIRFP